MPLTECVAALVVLALSASNVASATGELTRSSPPTDTGESWPWPNSLVVIGHSGATGWNSDPSQPLSDVRENSWATGDSSAVNSVYRRALAQNPELEGNNFNEALDGSNVDDLPRQVEWALAEVPLPDLFVIQSVDNDIRCDGTDDANYQTYGDRMAAVLSAISEAAPDARIFVVGLWATVDNYTEVTAQIPAALAGNQGGGPCDVFDQSGDELPEAMTYYQDVIDQYQAQLAAGCAMVPNCTYGGDAVRNMVIDADDLTADSYHLSVQGHAKMAEITWSVLYPDGPATDGT